jgi:hypothetical protein
VGDFPVHDIMTNGWPGEGALDAIGALGAEEREYARQRAGAEDLLTARLVAGARVAPVSGI